MEFKRVKIFGLTRYESNLKENGLSKYIIVKESDGYYRIRELRSTGYEYCKYSGYATDSKKLKNTIEYFNNEYTK